MRRIRCSTPSLKPRGGLVRVLPLYPSVVYELSAGIQLSSHPVSCRVGSLDAEGVAPRKGAVPVRGLLPVPRAASRTIVLFSGR